MSPELTLYMLWLLWLFSWGVAALWQARTARRSPRGSQLANRVFLIAGVALLFGVVSPRRMAMLQLWRLGDDQKWMLDGVVVAGFLFSWWARIYLGQLWSADVVAKEGHQVVDSGPYYLMRHPIYTGMLVAAFASAAIFGTFSAIAGAGLMTLAWYLKARLEEELMHETLGKAYDDYAARTPMLVPFTKFAKSDA